MGEEIEWRNEAKSKLKSKNFRSEARSIGKEVYEAFEKGNKDKANEITLEFLSDWASYFANGYTFDISIKTENGKVQYILYKKKHFDRGSEWIKEESYSFTNGDVPDIIDTLHVYWKGKEPEPYYREELVPPEYIGNMNKRRFKNIYRNIIHNELMGILSEIFNDISRDHAWGGK